MRPLAALRPSPAPMAPLRVYGKSVHVSNALVLGQSGPLSPSRPTGSRRRQQPSEPCTAVSSLRSYRSRISPAENDAVQLLSGDDTRSASIFCHLHSRLTLSRTIEVSKWHRLYRRKKGAYNALVRHPARMWVRSAV